MRRSLTATPRGRARAGDQHVLAQHRVMARAGGAGILPSGAVHLEAPTTVPDRCVQARSVLALYIRPALGGVRLDQLSRQAVRTTLAGLSARKLSPRTVRYLHAVRDVGSESRGGQHVPEAWSRRPMTLVEVEHAVLGGALPRVHGDPLDPRLEERRTLPGVGDPHPGLVVQPPEIRQAPGIDETPHEDRAQLVEFQDDDRPLRRHGVARSCR